MIITPSVNSALAALQHTATVLDPAIASLKGNMAKLRSSGAALSHKEVGAMRNEIVNLESTLIAAKDAVGLRPHGGHLGFLPAERANMALGRADRALGHDPRHAVEMVRKAERHLLESEGEIRAGLASRMSDATSALKASGTPANIELRNEAAARLFDKSLS